MTSMALLILSFFKDVVEVRVDHYKKIYKKPDKLNISEIFLYISLLNRLLLDEQNDSLNAHVSEEYL